jgi:hypothetical protein
MIRKKRRTQNFPTVGDGPPAMCDAAKGRYRRNPEIKKKTATPISRRAA